MVEEDAARDAGENDARDPEWVRRRRRERIFGDVLPETTADERGEASEDRGDRSEGRGEDWLRAQVPPHHGG